MKFLQSWMLKLLLRDFSSSRKGKGSAELVVSTFGMAWVRDEILPFI